jgi:hypothetical protein
MAEEGTLGLARTQVTDVELSKEDLQRRMDEARESISQTVTEIKDNVVQQYESVKETISETLDWREQFKKRPVAWTAGAVGAGFLTGYCITSMIKGDGHDHVGYQEGYEQARKNYQPRRRPAMLQSSIAESVSAGAAPNQEDSGPGLMTRIQETQAYDRLKNEASTIGDHLITEVSKTAKELLVPAAVGLIQHWLERLLPAKTVTTSRVQPTQ